MIRENLFSHLDPSLFQNIIFAILAIFISFAIVFRTDIFSSTVDNKNDFEKIILNDDIFGTKKVFWISICGVVFF